MRGPTPLYFPVPTQGMVANVPIHQLPEAALAGDLRQRAHDLAPAALHLYVGHGRGRWLSGHPRARPGDLQRQRGRWDDEVKSDGGKAKLHRQVRHQGKADTRRLVREEC